IVRQSLWRNTAVPAQGMTVSEEEKLMKLVREELGHRGYVVTVEGRREGEFVVGKLQVASAETDEVVARLVGAGKMENLNLCFGIDAEGTLRDAIVRAMTTCQGMQSCMPKCVGLATNP